MRKRKKSNKGDTKGTKIRKVSQNCDVSNTIGFNNFHDDIEIIKLIEEDENIEESDDDTDWIDVPEIPDTKSIIINLEDDSLVNNLKDDKRRQQRVEREYNLIIERTMFMSLLARVLYINKICNEDIIQHLAFSCFPQSFLNITHIRLDNLKKVIGIIKSEFHVIDDYEEEGNVRDILLKGFELRKISTVWINVAMVAMLRSRGFRIRLISVIYTRRFGGGVMLNQPTIYRPSTRGGNSRKPIKKLIQLSSSTQRQCIIFTTEVFEEDNQRWIPIDFSDISTIDNIPLIVEKYPPFLYVLSVDNNGFVKDASPRYDRRWAESSRRARFSKSSLERILIHLAPSERSDLDRLEDDTTRSEILSRGIPNTLADLKGHPYFALRKHLLKYEVIYPPDVLPFGQFNGEDVFLRDNVKIAHTRETWLKEAMNVKDGEVPCKRVRTMMATRKEKSHGTDPLVDIFGPWQIEKYIPSKAENGIVPVNSHGNVYLFQPTMIPEGCLHIRMNGIDKIAKRLQIDYAPAMIGWDFVKGQRVIPMFDGWVVCKENVKVLMDGLRELKQIEDAKRIADRERVVIKRWEVLTRRILLKERLRLEYNF